MYCRRLIVGNDSASSGTSTVECLNAHGVWETSHGTQNMPQGAPPSWQGVTIKLDGKTFVAGDEKHCEVFDSATQTWARRATLRSW